MKWVLMRCNVIVVLGLILAACMSLPKDAANVAVYSAGMTLPAGCQQLKPVIGTGHFIGAAGQNALYSLMEATHDAGGNLVMVTTNQEGTGVAEYTGIAYACPQPSPATSGH